MGVTYKFINKTQQIVLIVVKNTTMPYLPCTVKKIKKLIISKIEFGKQIPTAALYPHAQNRTIPKTKKKKNHNTHEKKYEKIRSIGYQKNNIINVKTRHLEKAQSYRKHAARDNDSNK